MLTESEYTTMTTATSLATLDDLLLDLEADKIASELREKVQDMPGFYRDFHVGVTQGIIAAMFRVHALKAALNNKEREASAGVG